MRTPALAVLSYCVVVALAAIASLAQTPPDFPMWCKGTAGMASSNGKNLIIDFKAGHDLAPDGLAPGQCSWLDRPLSSNEPTRIVSEQFSVATAKQVAGEINRGADWTFWVFNVGRFFKGTTSSEDNKGASLATFDHNKPAVSNPALPAYFRQVPRASFADLT